MQKRILSVAMLIALSGCAVQAQKSSSKQPNATPASERLQAQQKRQQLEQASLASNLKLRNVGPTVMSGRITDLEVSPKDPTVFYAAYASGGLWKTTNNGQSFEPLFDEQAVMTIGDIAVDWNNNETIWIGTGESNSSRSSYSGVGVYKSTDGGKTWQHMGLDDTHHIGKVLIHPTDPNTVWVAALGHLYSPNKERGVFKTTDGGKTWKKTLYIDDNTGAIDLQVDPKNPNNVYAAFWHRERRAWNFVEGGKSSGIHKSTDGGNTWTDISTASSGFPDNENVGRIGLSLYPGNPNIIYALVDNYDRRPAEKKANQPEMLDNDLFKGMTAEAFLKLDDKSLNEFLDQNRFPREITAKSLKAQVKSGELKPAALYDYLTDPTAERYATEVKGAEVYRTDDGGKTWKKTHDSFINDMYSSYGYYFGVVRVSPLNPDKIYILGVPLLTSDDGGKTFRNIEGENVHSDHQALWVSPDKPGYLINGNDGGINITYDDGKTWFYANNPSVGQFYSVAVDMAKPYNVYGGLQDNGTWMGPSNYKYSLDWTSRGKYPYERIGGGDGMMVQVDWRDNNIVYYGSQYGNYTRLNKATGERTFIKPTHKLGETPLRFNWESPIHLSRHNQDILYFGSNKFHRSMKKGEDMETLSGDLTNGGRKGDVGYGTLTSIDESPLRFGLLYTGSDDGVIQHSKDGGYTWTRISDKLPQNLWVSTVVASAHKQDRVYASLNGYRYDDFTPYLYVSEDNGKKWERIGGNLPMEAINVVKEDPKNPNLLYVGTDHGLYLSLDRGKTFMAMSNGMPAVSVHDVVVHPRENDLVVGTHGRSIYIAPVDHLQQLTPELMQEKLHLFAFKPVNYSDRWGSKWGAWGEVMEPELVVPFYTSAAGNTTIRIKTDKGQVLKEFKDESEKGLNYVSYNLSVDEANSRVYETALNTGKKEGTESIKVAPADNKVIYLQPGKYTVEVESNGVKKTQEFTLKAPERRSRG
ncbi:WD40/YVTN/BNR-like repeat-containing protein [Pontibacter cellulosilyticus]|uniref:Glycosyl hydrolase n=1 Tax=Pontibacter cellulosilyticus TaxID=1720253 RepID=A0A923NAK7_9BACT|nr:glycosyl hydrolase [Pontibacter cellulosilyticus]MBC5993425.1 glycosyl hydrolase [Pontibacter cellulosilyticus]